MTDTENLTELCNRYSNLYTAAVTDVMDTMDYKDRILDSNITPLATDQFQEEARVITGIAYPIKGSPDPSIDPDQNVYQILKAYEEAPAQSVLMTASNDREKKVALAGELTGRYLNQQGIRGIITDGGARDVSGLRQLDLPVFRRYDSPADAIPRWKPEAWGKNTQARVGGVTVEYGDIVIGDADGVAVVPKHIRHEVLTRAEEINRTENEVATALKNGMSPTEVFNEKGKI